MLKPLFLALQQRILDAGIGIEHLDWYNNQYADQGAENRQEGDFAYPAVFLEFLPMQFETFGKFQKTRLQFRVHLVTTNYAHSRAGLPEQQQALEHLELTALLYFHLQRFRAVDSQGRTLCNTCTRTRHTTDHNQTNQVVNIQEFETTAFDYAALKPRTPAQPQQAIQTTF